MMEYNTTRHHLKIREYGRNVQKMVEKAVKIEDSELRNYAAQMIIKVMSQINPSGKDSGDYWHKLWDHLFIISDYKLDVDSPYPKPKPRENTIDKTPIDYHKRKMKYSTYGKNIELMIKHISDYPECEEKKVLTVIMANQLKKIYLTWNRDSVNDELIAQHLKEYSEGKLVLPEDFQFENTKEIIAKTSNLNLSLVKYSKNSKKRKKKR